MSLTCLKSDKSAASPYQVYLADVSYFSGKLESYLRYKQIPYQSIEMDAVSAIEQVYENTGVLQVPVVKTPDDLWLKDSTAMIDWFERKHSVNSIFPHSKPSYFIAKLVEDYADEWCWRSAMYFRWQDPSSAYLMGRRIGKEVLSGLGIPASMTGKYFAYRQKKIFLYGDGLTKQTEPYIRSQYFSLLESFNTLLKKQKFLLGDRPSLVDVAFMGPFYRHYFCDTEPAKIMRDQYPQVLEWVVRMWNAKAENFDQSQTLNDFSQPGWQFVLKEVVQLYLPYLRQNAQAFQAGLKTFDFKTDELTLKKLPVVQYRVYCLEVLETLYKQLAEEDKQQVDNTFSDFGGLALNLNIESGLVAEQKLPLPPRSRKVKLWEKISVLTQGTPWDMKRPFVK